MEESSGLLIFVESLSVNLNFHKITASETAILVKFSQIHNLTKILHLDIIMEIVVMLTI
jgi:hypothetical protein